MNDFLRMIPIYCLVVISTVLLLVIINTQEHSISELYDAYYNQTKIDQLLLDHIHILEHNQVAMQIEINSMTNSSQIIDGFNMTSGECAKGFTMKNQNNVTYHCERQMFQ